MSVWFCDTTLEILKVRNGLAVYVIQIDSTIGDIYLPPILIIGSYILSISMLPQSMLSLPPASFASYCVIHLKQFGQQQIDHQD